MTSMTWPLGVRELSSRRHRLVFLASRIMAVSLFNCALDTDGALAQYKSVACQTDWLRIVHSAVTVIVCPPQHIIRVCHGN